MSSSHLKFLKNICERVVATPLEDKIFHFFWLNLQYNSSKTAMTRAKNPTIKMTEGQMLPKRQIRWMLFVGSVKISWRSAGLYRSLVRVVTAHSACFCVIPLDCSIWIIWMSVIGIEAGDDIALDWWSRLINVFKNRVATYHRKFKHQICLNEKFVMPNLLRNVFNQNQCKWEMSETSNSKTVAESDKKQMTFNNYPRRFPSISLDCCIQQVEHLILSANSFSHYKCQQVDTVRAL